MENQLVKIIQQNGLEQTKADYVLEKFNGFFAMASEWEQKAKAIVVTDASQLTEMKMARECRLFLKGKRVEVEKVRKELKEQSLREGKAIDGIANVLKALIEPIEEQLEKSEKFAEIQEQQRKESRKLKRIELLQPYGTDIDFYDLLNMPDNIFADLLTGQKTAFENKIAEEKRIEEERIAKEKAEAEERERLHLENERLKKKAIEREAAENVEREKQAAILAKQKAYAEKAAKILPSDFC